LFLSKKSSAETGEFDVFLLNDINDMKCYKVAIENQNFDKECDFLKSGSKTFLKQKTFSVNYLYSNFAQTGSPYAYFIIDNTKFPRDGSQPQNNLKVQSHYAAYIEPTKEYMKLVFTCKRFLLTKTNINSGNIIGMFSDFLHCMRIILFIPLQKSTG